jgi:hypothetical protein
LKILHLLGLQLCLVLIPTIFAQTTHAGWICSEPSEPSIPNGFYADEYQMERAKREVEDYLEEIQDYKECLIRNMEEANSEAGNVIDEWNTSVNRYNSK